MSKAIAVINQKGGVGKSTTALAIGAGLSLKGYSVLFIDLDAQGNLSYTLGADTKGYNAMGVLERPETAKEEIQHTPQGDIIASSPKLAGADKLLEETGKEYRLKEALESLQGAYDYIIVDLMEFDDEMMYKIKNKYGIEEAPNEIREVLMRKLIELARLEKARSHKTTVSI